jgi:hypothetical protein
MDRLKLAFEARYLIVLAGHVLERGIEARAREIAEKRSAAEVAPEDVEAATAEFLAEDLVDLPRRIERAMETHRYRSNEAA